MDALTRWQRRRALRRDGLPDEARAWLAAPWPDPGRHWRATGFTVLDLETSGLDPRRDAILAIGLVDVDEGRIRMETAWETLVSPPPGQPVGVPAIRVHGLLPDRLASAPPAAAVLPMLASRLAGRVLVVHVGDVARPFLARAFRAAWRCGLWMPSLDTARMTSWLDTHPQLGGRDQQDVPYRRLADIARSLGVPAGRQHDALADALTCAQVFLAQAGRLERLGLGTLGGLRRIGA